MSYDTMLAIDRKQHRPLHQPERCVACGHEDERDALLVTPERGEYLCDECGQVCACGCGKAFQENGGWLIHNGMYPLFYAKPCAEAIYEEEIEKCAASIDSSPFAPPEREAWLALEPLIRAWRQAKAQPLGESRAVA